MKHELYSWADSIINRQIPSDTPVHILRRPFFDNKFVEESFHSKYGEYIKDIPRNRNMWTLVDMQWTERLSHWIGKRRVLEVMSGSGWLARALEEHGVKIIPTDDFSWQRTQDNEPLVSIQKIDARNAVSKLGHDSDILLCSWPYMDNVFTETCYEWVQQKKGRPIIYIGEGYGGCTADDEFFEHFHEEKTINIPKFWGLHDRLEIGYFSS